MSLETELLARSQGKCEICGGDNAVSEQELGPKFDGTAAMAVLTCAICKAGVADEAAPHWTCLSDAIWSQTAPVQVLAFRLLHSLTSNLWARDLLDIAYLEPDLRTWAESDLPEEAGDDVVHKDSNGARLAAGDTVTLTKDLNVKGAGFTAKRGTAVRNISLVSHNAGHIEGRVNGQQIVILTAFVKKSG